MFDFLLYILLALNDHLTNLILSSTSNTGHNTGHDILAFYSSPDDGFKDFICQPLVQLMQSLNALWESFYNKYIPDYKVKTLMRYFSQNYVLPQEPKYMVLYAVSFHDKRYIVFECILHIQHFSLSLAAS